MSDSSTKPCYRVKPGGDTFKRIAETLYNNPEVADKLAVTNNMPLDAPLEEGIELKLPRVFLRDGPIGKDKNNIIIPLAVNTPNLCWVNFEEVLPTKESITTEPLADKWVYIVADGDIVVTIDANGDMAKERVGLKDPFAWTTELHALRYKPSIDEWNTWRFDNKQTSELFIASTLKQLIGTEKGVESPKKWSRINEESPSSCVRPKKAEQRW